MNEKEMALRVARSFMLAKARPSDMFAAVFFDIRQKAKDLKKKWSDEAKNKIEATLLNDLRTKGLEVEGKLSLGQYRGSKFVTSAKLKVKPVTQEQANKLLAYLQKKYSPKYKLKNLSEDGTADFNIR